MQAYTETGTTLPRVLVYRPHDLPGYSQPHDNADEAEEAVEQELHAIQQLPYNPTQPWAEGIVEIIPEDVLTPETLRLIRSAGGYHTPSMLRFVTRLEFSRRLTVIAAIADGLIPGRVGDRLKALDMLARIGVPQQVEMRPFHGDMKEFTDEELERIAGGEHPADVLEARTRRLGAGVAPTPDGGVDGRTVDS